jgi:hypothetical protein
MGPLALAWLVGEGIITYRSIKNNKCPPGPGQLLFSSGLFVLLALVAEAPSARTLAITLAWGFDVAAFMNLTAKTPKSANTWPPSYMPNTLVFPSRISGASSIGGIAVGGVQAGANTATGEIVGQGVLGGASKSATASGKGTATKTP